MSQDSTTFPINRNMPPKTIFAEASGAQRAQCFQLGAASFGAPLSAEQYLEREAFFDTLPLLRDGGLRVWCLLDAEDRNRVITTCKTVRRDLFIRDGPGEGRKAQGFCLASVVCDPQFRGQGFTSILLEEVAKWADGPGQAGVTFLYTSIGSFYEARGWSRYPAIQSTVRIQSSTPVHKGSLPSTSVLTALDIPQLCAIDTERFTTYMNELPVPEDTVLVAVYPNEDLISWLHDRSNFIGLETKGLIPISKGSIDEQRQVWAYWHHDFRKNSLTIQRISCPSVGSFPVEAVASVIVDARNEAAIWGFPQVSVWSPSPGVQKALRLLSRQVPDKIVYEEHRSNANPFLRWQLHNQSKRIEFVNNEFYAWN